MTRVATVFHCHMCTKESNCSKGRTSALLRAVVELNCSGRLKDSLDKSWRGQRPLRERLQSSEGAAAGAGRCGRRQSLAFL